MSSAPQVPGAEVRGQWREGYEQVLTQESLGLPADDLVGLLTSPASERIG